MDAPADERVYSDNEHSAPSNPSRPPSATPRARNKTSGHQGSPTTTAKRSSLSDDQSLTSFPSLSPSLANSPNASLKPGASSRNASNINTKPQLRSDAPPSIDRLFSSQSATGDRTALFGDSPTQVREVPGSVHHLTDKQIQHLVSRKGAIPLVKQLAQDLAQRDAQVILIQRKAEERERLLRQMLGECQVSNKAIDNRLKELLSQRQNSPRPLKVADPLHAGDVNSLLGGGTIDDQMSEALEDVIGGEDSPNGFSERSSMHSEGLQSPFALSRKSSVVLDRNNSDRGQTVTPPHSAGAGKGWKTWFGARNDASMQDHNPRATFKRVDSAQQRLAAIHTANQSNVQRKGLSSDLFKPPPDETSDANLTSGHSSTSNLQRTGSRDSSSQKAANRSSWALRLVGGRSKASSGASETSVQRDQAASTGDDAKTKAKQMDNASILRTKASATHVSPNQQRSTSANGPALAGMSKPSSEEAAAGAEPADEAQDTMEGRLGPVEMETFIPSESRPPTMLPLDDTDNDSDFLTDRFGFIYDQNRRRRQSHALAAVNRSKRVSRVETLENHRKSLYSLSGEEGDAASLSSFQSGADHELPRPNSPSTGEMRDDGRAAKRWQDYLSFSGLSSELLSQMPSVAPLTSIVTGDDDHASKLPHLVVLKDGAVPSGTPNPEPSSTPAVSGNAIFTSFANGQTTSTNQRNGNHTSNDPVKALLDQMTQVHDSSQREKSLKWNDFLRKVRADRSREGHGNITRDRRTASISVPEASWAEGEVVGVAGLGNAGKIGRDKARAFRSLVLGGIPVTLRAKIWAECSSALDIRVPGYYDDLVSRTEDDQTIEQQIQMDIPRTLTDNVFFRKGPGMAKLSNVLLAYSRRNPAIGYCQGMNLIAANLLLIMPTAEEAFWMLVAMIENILPEKYYDSSLQASRADQTVLRQYVGELLPPLSKHLDALGIELEALTFQWFLSVFTDCITAEGLFRVWDVVLCLQDGATFLFQVALSLLKLNEAPLLACSSAAEVYAYVNQHMTDHAVSIDGLIKSSDSLRKHVRSEDVVKRRARVMKEEEEQARRRAEERRIAKGKSRLIEEEDRNGAQKTTRKKVVTSGTQKKSPITSGAKDYTAPRIEADEMDVYPGELTMRTPLPIDEEVQWRA